MSTDPFRFELDMFYSSRVILEKQLEESSRDALFTSSQRNREVSSIHRVENYGTHA